MDTAGRLVALAREREAVLDACRRLDATQWIAPSCAPGWQVKDVIAHLGATVQMLCGPGMRAVWGGRPAEELNDDLVARRRNWPVSEVVGEFERYSGRALTMLRLVARPPVGSVRLPIAELGRYPMGLTPSLLLFDWHVHLRHDIAPAVGLPVPDTDAERMSAVLEWMLAGLEQMNRRTMGWVDRPLALRLDGPGGGRWQIAPAGAGLLRVTPFPTGQADAEIIGNTVEFPAWATTRTSWRAEGRVTLRGDTEYAARFLDTLNIV